MSQGVVCFGSASLVFAPCRNKRTLCHRLYISLVCSTAIRSRPCLPRTMSHAPPAQEEVRTRQNSGPTPARRLEPCNCNECQPRLYPPDIHIRPWLDLPKGLAFGAHEPLLLAQRAIDSFAFRGVTTWKEDRLVVLLNWWRKRLTTHPQHLGAKDLELPSIIFNALFFRNRIHGMELLLGTEDFTHNDLGSAYVHASIDKRSVRICIDPALLTMPLRLDTILNALLSRMIAGFLRQFSCDGTFCQREYCKEQAKRNLGVLGQGRAFLRLAHAIQAKAKPLFGFDMKLNIKQSLREEIEASGLHPSECDLRQYFGDRYSMKDGIWRKSAACRRGASTEDGSP